MNDRLYRSRHDRMIAGVAGGLADQLGLDPSLVRVGWVILAIVTGGLFALVYVVMMVVVPEEPDATGRWRAAPPPAPPPAPGAPGGSAGAATGPEAASAAGPEAASASPGRPDAAAGPEAATAERPTEAVPPPSWGPGRREARADWRQERREARADRSEERAAWRSSHRDPGGPVLIGLLLVLLGAWFLARRYVPAADFDALWPVAVVVAGIALLVLSIRPGRAEP